MARREPLNDEQRRLLRITGRMPLASVANLAASLGATEDRVWAMLGRLRSGGWVSSVLRGMTDRPQHRFFLTSRAVDLLYATDHRHHSPREEARASGLAAFHPEGELPSDFQKRFALDHDHPAHLEVPGDSPFAASEDEDADSSGETHDHEHTPWTATSRGVEMALRRLAMLEPVYRLAPDLIRSGRDSWPSGEAAATREVRMTDFRLLRRGGFYQAVARYGEQVWTPFTYAGIHATERVLRRKEQHRFWGVDCYSSEEDRYLRIGNRTFYEDPDEQVSPSAQVVVAVDAWAREWPRAPSPVPRPLCSAPRTGGAPRRWNCGHQGTWCPTRRVIPPWAGRRRRTSGSGRTPTRRPSTAGWPTGCSWPSASSPPCGPPGSRRLLEAPPTRCPATWAGSWIPGWWRCSTGGTTCRNWG